MGKWTSESRTNIQIGITSQINLLFKHQQSIFKKENLNMFNKFHATKLIVFLMRLDGVNSIPSAHNRRSMIAIH